MTKLKIADNENKYETIPQKSLNQREIKPEFELNSNTKLPKKAIRNYLTLAAYIATTLWETSLYLSFEIFKYCQTKGKKI